MTIVVATDYSENAGRALALGARLAARSKQPLHIVHVSEDPRAALLIGVAEEALLATDHARLRDAVASVSTVAGLTVTSELLAGPVADALSAVAERLEAELLMLAASQRPGGVLGSTAEKLARGTRVPLMIVRAPERFEAWLARDEPLRVLVGSDLGNASRDAEAFVALLHRAGPLDLHVVSVAHPALVHTRYGLAPPADLNRLDPAAEQLVLRDLSRQGEGFAWRDARQVACITGTSSADAHLAILSQDMDVVVVGLRKRSWLAQAWYGSAARGILRAAPVSVVCVPRSLDAPSIPRRPRARVVVVATDLSELGDEAVSTALSVSQDGATIHVVHVLVGVLEHDAEARTAARQRLQQRIPKELDGRTIQIEVLSGTPAEAVVGYARRVGADLLCVGSHGRSGMGAVVLGSTSHEVIAHAEIPVLIVPPAPA